MRIILSCIFLLALAVAAHAAKPLPVDQISAPQPLLPYCDWLPDPGGQLTIDSITSDAVQQRFTPLPGRFPLKAEGPVWLRLVIVKSQPGPAADASRLSVRLGALPPGETYLYMSKASDQPDDEDVWHGERILPHEIIELPEPGLLPVSVYIRMDETPGLWFAPTISAKGTVRPDVLPFALILPGLFIAAAAACLLRALAERAQWAFWAALFLLCALAQALLPLPALSRGFRPEHLPALLAPGMLLILLPHIGRCMFRASGLSPTRDAILYLCSFIGVAVALGPLLPGLAWLTRLFPLWPLLTVPLLPLGVSALAARQPGALAFSGACAMPLLGAGVALHALYSAPFMHPLAAQGSLWGLAVGGIGLVLARIPDGGKVAPKADTANAPAPAGLVLAESAADAAKAQAADSGLKLGETPAFTRRSQYDELPPLEIMRLGDGQDDKPCELPDLTQFIQPARNDQAAPTDPAAAAAEAVQDMPPAAAAAGHTPPPDDSPVNVLTHDAEKADSSHILAQEHLPEDREPSLPDAGVLSGEAPSLQEEVIPTTQKVPDSEYAAQEKPDAAPVAREIQDAPGTPGPEQNRVIPFNDKLSAFGAELREMEEEATRQTSFATENGFLFNLHSLVREVHNVVAPLAKSRGLVFSWYISPLLPPLLEGDAPRLRGALTLLLQNAVLATRKGSVQLAVRKNPGSSDPGNLLFVIVDNGSAQRTEAGFFHAWEMAARTGGVFTVEYSPLGGTQISFTVRFALPSEQTPGELLGVAADSDSGLADESEDDDLMPVLSNVLTPAGGYWAALASPEPSLSAAEDLSITPEQVLREQGFLEPLPAPPANEAPLTTLQNEDKGLSAPLPATAEPPSRAAPSPDSPAGEEDKHLATPSEPRTAASTATAAKPLTLTSSASPMPDSAQHPVPADAAHGTRADVAPVAAPLSVAAPTVAVSPLPGLRRVIAAEMTTSNRRLLSHYLTDLPHEHLSADTNAQVPGMFRAGPVSLIIFDGDTPEHDIIRALRAVRDEERKNGLPPTCVLVLTSHEAQCRRLLENGATHTLIKPISKEALYAIAAQTPPVEPAPLTKTPTDASHTPPRILEERPPTQPHVTPSTAEHGNEREVDLLAEALRDAPQQQQGAPLEVSLPPRHGTDAPHTPPRILEERPPTQPHVTPSTAEHGNEREVDLLAEALRDAPQQQQGASLEVSLPPRHGTDAPYTPPRISPYIPKETPPTQPHATPNTAEHGNEREVDLLAEALRDAPQQQGAPLEVSLPPRHGTDAPHTPPRILEERPPTQPHATPNTAEYGNEREVDILTEALRDAPQQQGAPLEVSLPPRHGIATAQDGLVTTGAQLTPVQEIMPPEHDVLSPGDAAAAAPMLRNLSLEDVTPVLSQTRNDHPPVGSLLDFVLPDAFPPAPPESREPEQDAKDLPATRPDETPEEEQNAPEAPKAESEDAKGAPEHLSGQEDQPESRESEQDSKGLPGARPDDRLEEKQGAPERESENANRQDTPEQLPKSDAPESEAEHLPKQETPKPKAALKLEITPRPKAAPKPKTTPKPEVVPEPEVAPADESEKNAGQAREPISFFSLPGLEGEVIDVSVLPLTPGLVFSLQEIMREIRQSAERDQSILIQEAAGRMAGKAEAFGLVKLGRLAHCVERAAEANDMEAVRTLLEDLGPVVVRYVQSLQECFNAYLYTDR